MDQLLLGIDIGTSACKVALFEPSGKVLAQSNQGYPVYYPKPGWVEQDPEEWWAAICKGIRETIETARIRPDQIAGIGIDGQSWSCIPVDREGKCLHNTPIWMDIRAREIAGRVTREIGFDRIFEVSGNGFEPSYTTPKMIWFKEQMPEVYKKTDKFLQSNSYIGMKLTGVMSQEVCQGYGLHFFDINGLRYDAELAKDMGLSVDKVPQLFACHEVIGTVSAEARRRPDWRLEPG